MLPVLPLPLVLVLVLLPADPTEPSLPPPTSVAAQSTTVTVFASDPDDPDRR